MSDMNKYVTYKGMSFYKGDENTFEPIIDKIVKLQEKNNSSLIEEISHLLKRLKNKSTFAKKNIGNG